MTIKTIQRRKRKFDGKLYNLYDLTKTKTQAKAIAKKQRCRGYNVRTVKSPKALQKEGSNYEIYQRK